MDKTEDGRKSSILKPQKPRSPFTVLESNDPAADTDTTLGKQSRRVSFASSNFVKPFLTDEVKNTIWDTTYEEVIEQTDSTHSNGSNYTHSNSAMELTQNIELITAATNNRRTTINFNTIGGEDMIIDEEINQTVTCSTKQLCGNTVLFNDNMEFTQTVPYASLEQNYCIASQERTSKKSLIEIARKQRETNNENTVAQECEQFLANAEQRTGKKSLIEIAKKQRETSNGNTVAQECEQFLANAEQKSGKKSLIEIAKKQRETSNGNTVAQEGEQFLPCMEQSTGKKSLIEIARRQRDNQTEQLVFEIPNHNKTAFADSIMELTTTASHHIETNQVLRTSINAHSMTDMELTIQSPTKNTTMNSTDMEFTKTVGEVLHAQITKPVSPVQVQTLKECMNRTRIAEESIEISLQSSVPQMSATYVKSTENLQLNGKTSPVKQLNISDKETKEDTRRASSQLFEDKPSHSEFSRIIEGDYNPPVNSKLVALSDSIPIFLDQSKNSSCHVTPAEKPLSDESCLLISEEEATPSASPIRELVSPRMSTIEYEEVDDVNIKEEKRESITLELLKNIDERLIRCSLPQLTVHSYKEKFDELKAGIERELKKLTPEAFQIEIAAESCVSDSDISCSVKEDDNEREESSSECRISYEEEKSIKEKIQERAERCKWFWTITNIEDEKYQFLTMYNSLSFTVHFNEETGMVKHLETSTIVSDKMKPISKYVLNLFEKQLSANVVHSFLGKNYDILSLLDYVQMMMQKMLDILTESDKLASSYCLKMDEDSRVTFKIVDFDLLQVWIISVAYSEMNITEDCIEAHAEVGTLNVQKIKQCTADCPKGFLFFRSFIDNIKTYMKNTKKTNRK